MGDNDVIKKDSGEKAKELLIEDYRYLSDSFWKNEQTGETRVNLFIGFVTLVAGGLVGLATSDKGPKGEHLRLIIFASLFSLLVLGLITLIRILVRNKNTDRYKQGLDTIRQLFKDRFDDEHVLLHYYPVGYRSKEKEIENKEKGIKSKEKGDNSKLCKYKSVFELRKFGGLAHTVAAINSLIVAGIAGVALYPVSLQNSQAGITQTTSLIGVYIAVAMSFTISFAVQLMYIVYREAKAKEELGKSLYTHAFGVVFRMMEGDVKYLLVRPKDENKPNEWVFPKGHIEPGEGHAEAALREVREESGVMARVICLIDQIVFSIGKEQIHGKCYLMEYLYETKAQEARGMNWFAKEEALKELTYPESRHILQEAEKKRIG